MGAVDENHIFVLQLVATDDVVAAEVGAWVGPELYTAEGTSKRDKKDKPDTTVGLKLALGRAIRQLGRNILHDGQLAVHEADKLRQAQAKAGEEARKRAVARATAAKKAVKKAPAKKKAAAKKAPAKAKA